MPNNNGWQENIDQTAVALGTPQDAKATSSTADGTVVGLLKGIYGNGGGGGGGGGAVTVADGADVTLGTSTDANTVASVMGRLTKIRDLLNATLTVQGTITEANSAAILVDLALLAGAISGGKMLTTETSSAAAKADLDTLVTQTSGIATAANQATGNTSLASIVTNTANIPAKGQATMANSAPVVLASNQSMVPTNNAQVAGTAVSVNAGNRDAGTQRFIESGNPTPTVTQVGSANTDTSLLAANANKKGTLFFNDSTATLYLLYGTGTASTTNYSVQVPPKAYFEDPLHYTGGFHGIWSAANGFVYCTEVS